MPAPTLEQDADRAAAAGDFSGAREMLERAATADGSSPGLWMKLAAVRNASGDMSGALAAVDECLALSPLDASALLFKASLLDRLGDPRAGQQFGHALAQLPDDSELPEPMKPAIAHARRRWREYQEEVEARLQRALPPDLSGAEQRRLNRFISNRSRRTQHFHQEPTEFHYPELPEVEFHDRSDFPELAGLESATEAIRVEFNQLIAAEAADIVPYIEYPANVPLRQWKALNRSDKWSAIHLLRNGERVEANARHCPRTLEAVGRLPQPQIRGASPNAMFSLLAPKTKIPPHTGVSNTRLVCHLPLIVPPGCGFRCGGTTREWEVGESFVFDDTIEHEAWNDSDQLRVVLILDLWAPALSQSERESVASVIETCGVSFMGS